MSKVLGEQMAVFFVSVQSLTAMTIGLLVVALVFLAISYRVTLTIYQKKEF